MNEIIEAFRASNKAGDFLFPSSGETCWCKGPGGLDGSNVAKWLRAQGYEVVKNWDCGRNGWAVTKCGLKVSTNGYFCRA